MYLARLRKRRLREFDPFDELKIGKTANALMEKVLSLELALIREGFDLPVGGSLLAVATKKGE
jgi:hypothetical protein